MSFRRKCPPSPLLCSSARESSAPVGCRRVTLGDNVALAVDLSDGTTVTAAAGVLVKWPELRRGGTLGSGNQATVHKVTHDATATEYALKSIPVNRKTSLELLQRELQHIARPQHPNVVPSLEAYFAEDSLRVLMVYMDRGTLRDLLDAAGPLPDPVLANITAQVASGLQFLHSLGVIHRDLKPSNILLNSEGRVRVSDFGVAITQHSNESLTTNEGAIVYMSPERRQRRMYDTSSDIWSLGLTVLQCSLGVLPLFTDSETESTPTNTQSLSLFELELVGAEGRAQVDIAATLAKSNVIPGSELMDFVDCCLQDDPALRPTAAALQSHHFLGRFEGQVCLRYWLVQRVGSSPQSAEPHLSPCPNSCPPVACLHHLG